MLRQRTIEESLTLTTFSVMLTHVMKYFTPSFVEIPSPSTEISCHEKQVLTPLKERLGFCDEHCSLTLYDTVISALVSSWGSYWLPNLNLSQAVF